jgi:hypothetical protein
MRALALKSRLQRARPSSQRWNCATPERLVQTQRGDGGHAGRMRLQLRVPREQLRPSGEAPSAAALRLWLGRSRSRGALKEIPS